MLSQARIKNRYHLKYFPKGSADLDGFINYLQKPSKNKIENEIAIDGKYVPLTYKIEISKDNYTWHEIDRQNRGPFMDWQYETNAFTFSIDKTKQKEAKYIGLTETENNSSGNGHLNFEAIEFYGYLQS